MKKAVKIALPLLLIAFIFSTQAIEGPYLVTLSEVYEYDVIESDLNVTFGTNTADLDGFEIDGQFFNPGTAVLLNISNVLADEITYYIQSGSYAEIRSTTPLDLLYMLLYMIYPIGIIHDVSVDTWNATELEENYHLGIMMIPPFIQVETDTWEGWIETVEEINANKTIFAYTFTDALTVEAHYLNLTTDFVFELYMSGQLDEQYTSFLTTSTINVTIEHQFQFAYTKATGVMLGMRMEGTISGLANGTIVEMDYNYKTEQIGYDLPSYALGGPTWPFPGFEYLIAFSALTVIVIPILIRKRKN
ncbi:MAG: hypothetical protein FK732_08215 [Asgard group archaeon]|nr:hypothetical protein [Asgard group archaeon]